MAAVSFTVVDVFSNVPFKGNPLAIVDARTHQLSTTQLQLITRQFNLSETTFILPPTNQIATYKLRSFLPNGKEVFGAGHNILGAWWQLAHSGLLDLQESRTTQTSNGYLVQQELGSQVSPIQVVKDLQIRGEAKFEVVLRQPPPQLHGIHPDLKCLAHSIGLEETDLGFTAFGGGKALPPQVASTSTTYHLLVPLASVESLNRVNVQRDSLLRQLRAADERAYGLFLFAKTGKNRYEARFFSPGMSAEDPATGSAAGPLSAYLYEHGDLELVDGRGWVEVTQGLQVGRECVIQVTLSVENSEDGERRHVDLVGGAIVVAEGKIAVPDTSTLF
ncbi:hypothetical protein S7711_06092 [Stachybotrys chartarum IBT 7711]|uniref:Phenazine biosynthesis protein n=1 Tax=Stachybotrys chartarum (strain CBS 109288 / IBT 7711) TaxID=1280523 RepID=A0A084B8K3_STACB|nr:hypothetical protein S7711_06092 [Stachybotrys chartarum IBT 7711]